MQRMPKKRLTVSAPLAMRFYLPIGNNCPTKKGGRLMWHAIHTQCSLRRPTPYSRTHLSRGGVQGGRGSRGSGSRGTIARLYWLDVNNVSLRLWALYERPDPRIPNRFRIQYTVTYSKGACPNSSTAREYITGGSFQRQPKEQVVFHPDEQKKTS